jgi:lysophospholipase L1-like esterase
MALMPSKRTRMAALATACAGVTMIGVAGLSGAVSAAPTSMTAHHAVATKHAQPKVRAGSRYLALGDSVPFGFRESNAIPTGKNDYSKPKTFIGYPEDVAKNLGLKVANLACPGETTSSLINPKKASNGCENHFDTTTGKQVAGGYVPTNPLHVKYKDTTKNNGQLATAVKYLKSHKNVRLVSLMIGANDGFLCLTKDAVKPGSCNLGTAVAKISKNVGRIMKRIRGKAGYSGQIVLVNYYSTNYADAAATAQSKLLNSALVAAVKPFKVEVANAFGAFRKAAKQAGGNTCTAQLLTQLKTSPASCGVHPSVSGQALLAQALEQTIKK